MKPRRIFVLLAFLLLVYLLLTSPDDGDLGIRNWFSLEPTPVPTVCNNFDFQGLLGGGFSVRMIVALDTNDDNIEECIVLYDDPAEQRSPATGRPVYGMVYHFQVSGPADADPRTLPISAMRCYELRTDYGRRVRLGLTTSEVSDFHVLAMDADTQGRLELVVLSHGPKRQLVGLSVFRWRGVDRGYQLVGYVHGDWLKTRPSPVERYIDEVVVCDRQYPADANNPDRVTGKVFVWKDGKLELDPDHSDANC